MDFVLDSWIVKVSSGLEAKKVVLVITELLLFISQKMMVWPTTMFLLSQKMQQ